MNILLGWRRQQGAGLPTPTASDTVAQGAERLFWGWAAMAGATLFVIVWLQQRGVWRMMLEGDTTGISAGIVVLSLVVTLWCGWRARRLQCEALPNSAWRRAYHADVAAGTEVSLHSLAERTHGAHETAWWFASATLKLGLLGTVVGFIVMSSQIGDMPSFDFDQVQVLLKRMTQGMAIALYTTLVGLIGNLWLGLQLMLLDRQADTIAADILARNGNVAGPA